MPVVYSYYQPVPGLPVPGRLLALWAKSWQDKGWTPKVLNEEHARSHPGFEYFEKRISRFPTINNRAYERACFLRHLAMANIGGGLIVDYDVLLMSTEDPGQFGKLPPRPVIFEPTRVPCAVLGDGNAFEELCDILCEYEPKHEQHVSDMTIVRKTNLQAESYCVEHLCSGRPIPDDLGDGWKKAPMIHFSGYSFKKLGWGGDKADMIQRVLHSL